MTLLEHDPVAVALRRPAERDVQAGRPLRVALFSGNYDCVRDGANQALNRLVSYLMNKRGAQVRIYSPRAPKPAFRSVGDVRAVRSFSLPGRPEYRLALGFTRSARLDFDSFDPDIVHLSAPDILARQAQKYARRKGVAVVASLHTRFETYAEYYRLGFLRGTIERYLDRFYGDCDHILAPNRPIADQMAARHGARRVSIWGRGVDPSLFNPALRCEKLRASLGYGPDEVMPLFFGRLVMEKGLGVFLDAITLLREKGHYVRPLIVGDGPARAWLNARLSNATFAGHLEGPALGRAIASADMLINPSVTEAFGNVNLEAMASGLPVISAHVDSAASLIVDGKNGVLAPPQDAAAMAAAAEALILDPDRRRMLGRMASASARRYRWDDVLAPVFDVYGTLVPPSRGVRPEPMSACAG